MIQELGSRVSGMQHQWAGCDDHSDQASGMSPVEAEDAQLVDNADEG